MTTYNSEEVLFEKNIFTLFGKKQKIVLTEYNLYIPESGVVDVYSVDDIVSVKINPPERKNNSLRNTILSGVFSFFSFALALLIYEEVLFVISFFCFIACIIFLYNSRPQYSISIFLNNGYIAYYYNPNIALLEELAFEIKDLLSIIEEEKEEDRKNMKKKEAFNKKIEDIIEEADNINVDNYLSKYK